MKSNIKVLIADDHALLRTGLSMLLNAQPDIEVVAEAADVSDAVDRTRQVNPDIVLLDISMPGPGLAPGIEQLLAAHDRARVIVLTMHDDSAYMRAALHAGAAGYVVKKAADSELIGAIRAVHGGRTFVDLTRAGTLTGRTGVATDEGEASLARPLSGRERDVVRLLSEGHTNKSIAERLGVSVKTIETYRSRLVKKLGLRTRAEFYRFARESGMLARELSLTIN